MGDNGLNIYRLQFSTPQDFTSFRKATSAKILEIIIASLTITCKATETELHKATVTYGATLIDPLSLS